jgi:predicted ArsR family transcriptional regulator
MARTTARQQVLEYIRRRNAATAAQIGQGLSMSAAAVRHHLSILAADGRIVEDRRNGKRTRGRPEKIYRLSDHVAGDNLGVLSDMVLSAWFEGLEGQAREAAIEAMAASLAERTGPLEAGAPATKRMVQLVDKLNALHYQARWEAGAEGPRIVFGHCPYRGIIERHPELCTMDTLCLSKLLKAPVEQRTKINSGAGEASQCLFAVKRGPSRGD